MARQLSVIVGEPERAGESPLRRSYLAESGVWKAPQGHESCKTVYELAKRGYKQFASKRALGQREFIKVHTEKKNVQKKINGEIKTVEKEWQYFELGKYNWITFAELEQATENVASGLIHFGIQPGKDRFELYAKTCREWMISALGLMSQSMTIVTAYDTLGIEGLTSSIKSTGTAGILTDKDNLALLAKALPDCPSIKLVVYRTTEGPLDDKNKEQIEQIKQLRDGAVKVVSFEEVIEAGKKHPQPPLPPKPEDIACIMYTSGSTGPPKGVVLLQSGVLAGISGATGVINRSYVNEHDVFLSILPLAHIFELTAELSFLVWGSALGYGTPKTVSDTNMRNCAGDIRELKPTIFVAVPAVWEALKKGITAKVAASSGVSQKVFWGAYHLKTTMRHYHLPVPLVDRVIFKKIKEALGGRLRYVMSGGASLSYETRLFLETLIAPCIMGYGLTETNAMGGLTCPGRLDLDTTGEIPPAITVKLVDVPEAGYFAKNGQGELLMKGPSITPGYYQNEKETKEAITEDGWFQTGDIAQFSSEGKVMIIDRKKNLVKTLNGEYIAIERLESLYRTNQFINNICIFADDAHARPVAVVVPMENAVKSLCEEIGVEYSELAIHDKKVNHGILESIQETGRSQKFNSSEIIAAIVLSDEEWTPQNGLVSSAQKVQRRLIKNQYAEGLKQAFEEA